MDGFEFQTRDSGSVTLLDLKGYLDAHTAPQLEKALQNSLEAKKYRILVNFKDLSYISSAGLGVFMGFVEEIRENGGDLKFCCMNAKIYRVFDLLGFPTLFEIFDTEEEGVRAFEAPASQ